MLARFWKAFAALAVPVLGLLVAFGVDLTEDQIKALLTFVTVATPLVVAAAPANAPNTTPPSGTPTALDAGKPTQGPFTADPVGDPERLPNA